MNNIKVNKIQTTVFYSNIHSTINHTFHSCFIMSKILKVTKNVLIMDYPLAMVFVENHFSRKMHFSMSLILASTLVAFICLFIVGLCIDSCYFYCLRVSVNFMSIVFIFFYEERRYFQISSIT